MSSDPFEFFGLDRKTATDADVRAAYAERLKVTRPEDDRAAFMALRAAFEQARSSIRWRDQYGDDDDEDEEDYGEDEYARQADEALEELNAAQRAEAEVNPPTEDEAEAYEDRPGRAMDTLVDVLTGSPFGVSAKRVMEIVEADEVSGIDDYQSLQWQVRNFLCDRTGYNLDPKTLRLPDWLTLEVLNALDGYFGWTRQPAQQVWVRKMNDWLVSVRKQLELEALPKAERKQRELDRLTGKSGDTETWPMSIDRGHERGGDGNTEDKGSLRWLFIGAGVILYGIVQFLMRAGGG